jgi:hypothetical protein
VYGGGFFYALNITLKEFRANCRFVPFIAGAGYEIFEAGAGRSMDEYLTIFEVAELLG